MPEESNAKTNNRKVPKPATALICSLVGIAYAGLCAASYNTNADDESPCYTEVDNCTVCYNFGANILCGGGAIECPDIIIGNDPPARTVIETETGFHYKRSENYGNCTWQPRKPNPQGGCMDDGPQQHAENWMDEEVYGDDDCGTGGGGTS